MNFLIIDDDSDFCDLLKQGLDREGHPTLTASQFDLIFPLLEQHSFDYIFLDLNFHKTSSLTFLEDILALKKDGKVIILTGFASISTAVDTVKRGAFDYLSKPITAKSLLSHLLTYKEASSSTLEWPLASTALGLKEWETIQDTLKQVDFNITKAAASLGISRRTLQRKLKQGKPL